MVYEEAEEEEEPAPESLEQRQLDTMLSESLFGSKLEGPQSRTFSSMTMEDFTWLKITCTCMIHLKPNLAERIEATNTLGQGELWSSANLYRQLHFLENHIPRANEASAHAWIDAFLFRASAMLPPDKYMILNKEHVVPATAISPSGLQTLSGIVDYTAIVASQSDDAGFYLTPASFHEIKAIMPSSFFVIEAKLHDPNHIVQVLSKMYACGKFLQQKVLRGALINGHDWIFLLMTLNDDYDGASYVRSAELSLGIHGLVGGELVIHRRSLDLIAGILSHWIENSFSDLGSDDWFTA
ncbi:uncharacterized protein BJ212DRAFT_1313648 [Suillus subaureus]|uniref:Uncharacterized protein n=1 Tax=Suillus subaureus TaxID=48587 RepID=A0A9P7EPL0_9AGAM|nr:uncharacterized protein BJ212DRAFT_1313648 [Suillus subaureus]KAG1827625.1 hypothetical protein BJ212DRAFT_1313648 [Suillus subaureus]